MQILELSVLSTLIETMFPAGVTFNRWGVAQSGLRYVFTFRKLSVTMDLRSLNGVWGGSMDISTNLWGMGEPLIRSDFKFPSFEECADSLWRRAHDYIERHRDNVSSEFLHFKVAEKKWFTLSPDEKINMFKEANFYDT